MASHMRAELVIDALTMAVAARGGNVGGVIFHADRGSQYTSAAFAQVCDPRVVELFQAGQLHNDIALPVSITMRTAPSRNLGVYVRCLEPTDPNFPCTDSTL